MTTDQQIIDLFVEQGLVQRSGVEDLLAEINHSGKTLLQVMTDFEIVNEEQYHRTIADSIGPTTSGWTTTRCRRKSSA